MTKPRRNIAGQRFGRLVAIRDIGRIGNLRLWEFRCDCGRSYEQSSVRVTSGKTRSCGCLQREEASKARVKDLIGRRFGRLTVVAYAGIRSRRATWYCKCDCDEECEASSNVLLHGLKRSCGCLALESVRAVGRANKKDPEEKRKGRRAWESAYYGEPRRALVRRLQAGLRDALKAVKSDKPAPTFELLGYSRQQFRDHIERQFGRGMGWHNIQDWDIDHIVPISTAENLDDVIALNQLSNLRPLWREENNAKRAMRLSLL